MSRHTQPMLGLGNTQMSPTPPSKSKIHTHTRRNVTSPSTAPLLGFLLHFAKNDQDYLDVIKKTAPKKLWGIGRKSTPKFCGPCPWGSDSDDDGSSDDNGSSDGEVQDESAQDKDELLDIVNGNGLPQLTKKYDVG
jgi:hypothetical protein